MTDQSFNDEELQEIMNEIEDLEQDSQDPQEDTFDADSEMESAEPLVEAAIEPESVEPLVEPAPASDPVSESIEDSAEDLITEEDLELLEGIESEAEVTPEVTAEAAVEPVVEVVEAPEVIAESEPVAVVDELESSLEGIIGGGGDKLDSGDLLLTEDEISKTNLQSVIDNEVNVVRQATDEDMTSSDGSAAVEASAESVAIVAAPEPDPVVSSISDAPSLKKASTPIDGGVSLAAQGNMELDLNFNFGELPASIQIHPKDGIKISINGVLLDLNPDTGMEVVMPSGVKLTIPLESDTTDLKKAS
jgi:hypothetical protein